MSIKLLTKNSPRKLLAVVLLGLILNACGGPTPTENPNPNISFTLTQVKVTADSNGSFNITWKNPTNPSREITHIIVRASGYSSVTEREVQDTQENRYNYIGNGTTQAEIFTGLNNSLFYSFNFDAVFTDDSIVRGVGQFLSRIRYADDTVPPPPVEPQLPVDYITLRNMAVSVGGSPLNVLAGNYTDADGDEVGFIIHDVATNNNRAGYINRPLIIAPGLTGALAPNQFNTNELYNHSIVIVMGFRRTSFDRDLYGCDELDATFSSCLPGYAELPQFNPRQTATDIIDVMRLLNSDALISIEGAATSASSYFGTGEEFFNDVDVYTSSYGGTVVSYMAKELQDATNANGGTPPFTINRLVVDNGDGPNAKVISQGFAINLNRTNRLLDACAMNSFCNSNYKDDLDNLDVWMEEHHNTSITLYIDNNQTIENANIYSSTLFTIWDEAWEQSTRSSNLTGPVIEILAGVAANASAMNVTIDASSWTGEQFDEIIDIINEVTVGMPPLRNEGYAGNFIPLNDFLMLLNMLGQNMDLPLMADEIKREFISRIGLVCSSYITRTNDPDSQDFYDEQLMDPTLSPWRYGFLIIYRNILDICGEEGVQSNLASPALTAPANVQLEIDKGLIYYGGMDVKHSLESAIDIQSNFKNTELLVENLRGQAGGPEGGDTANAVFMEFFNSDSVTVNRAPVDAANSRGLDRIFGP